VARRAGPGQLVRLLVQPQQEGPEPACKARINERINRDSETN
jgi:hypothetical protein